MIFTDRSGRKIGYLRLSLTRACQMRCTYCRPSWLTNPYDVDALTPTEFEQFVRHLVSRHGLHKVRLTGGDPTARHDLIEIIERLASIDGVTDLSMTTNGLSLAHRARDYAAAGLDRVNISLDTLDQQRFYRMTGVNGLNRVLEGIDAALEAGLTPIKINTVVLRDDNEHDLPGLVDFVSGKNVEIRFIELMPMGPLADRWIDRYVPAHRMRKTLNAIVAQWRPLPQGSDSARRYKAQLHDGRSAVIGFITPMSCNFCSDCNRIRVTSNGELYPCLMDRPSGSLMPAIRPTFDADRLDNLIDAGLSEKKAEHPHDGFVVMTHIGG